MKSTTVLIPTYNRPDALAVTLTSLCFQDDKDFDIVISDQSQENTVFNNAAVSTAIRVLETRGHAVRIFRNLPAKGMAQQRQFLLDHSNTRFSLFIDDDLILESFVIRNMKNTLVLEDCGYVGCAVIGLSFRDDVRPHEQEIELWKEKVKPETIIPNGLQWTRYKVHNAANIYHIAQNLNAHPDHPLLYKVAWVGGCTMYNTERLKEVGGFNFWMELPEKHCGEDVLAQLRVMKKYGACGILPSGVYHQEHKTTVPDRQINAPEYLEI
jgi:glycosyltransferase involved in cell wall biosynthesis